MIKQLAQPENRRIIALGNEVKRTVLVRTLEQDINGCSVVDLPSGAQILKIDVVGAFANVYALCDLGCEHDEFTFKFVGDRGLLEGLDWEYIDSVEYGTDYKFHVFMKK